MSRTTHYRVLGVEPSATQSQVRDAYRVLARRLHPDVCDEPDAAERFARVAEAYEVLGDASRRRAYDASLAEAPRLEVSRGVAHYTWSNIAARPTGDGDAGPTDLDEMYDAFFGS